MKPEELARDIEKGDLGPLYYLYGDEPYLVEKAVKKMLERLVDPGFRDFNLDQFYGNECKGEEIFSAVQTLPMFAERRVVLVKRGQDLPAVAHDLLCSYVQNPSPSTCLIFQGEKIDQRKKFFTEFKKTGELVEFKRPYDNQLGPFIREEARSFGKRIDPAAMELLAILVGNNLQEMSSQVEKVAVYAGSRDLIGVEDVKGIVSGTRVDTVFEFSDALGERDLGRALRSLGTLLRDGEAPLMILAILARHFRQLWKVRELLDKKTPHADIGKALGINPYFLKKTVSQAAKYRRSEMKGIFSRLLEMDLGFKSGTTKPDIVLEQFVMELCGKR